MLVKQCAFMHMLLETTRMCAYGSMCTNKKEYGMSKRLSAVDTSFMHCIIFSGELR